MTDLSGTQHIIRTPPLLQEACQYAEGRKAGLTC